MHQILKQVPRPARALALLRSKTVRPKSWAKYCLRSYNLYAALAAVNAIGSQQVHEVVLSSSGCAQMQAEDVGPALQWAAQHRANLSSKDVTAFEFQLHTFLFLTTLDTAGVLPGRHFRRSTIRGMRCITTWGSA